MSIRIPFGKKTLIFPYNPNDFADLIFTLLANKGKVAILSEGPTASWKSGKCEIVSSSMLVPLTAQFSVKTSVFYKNQQVLILIGKWENKALETKVQLYVPGDWEKKIRDAV